MPRWPVPIFEMGGVKKRLTLSVFPQSRARFLKFAVLFSLILMRQGNSVKPLPSGRYQVVSGIVSPVSDSYGKQGLVPAEHRVAMATLALQSSSWVRVDEWESRQPDWTETAVTMR